MTYLKTGMLVLIIFFYACAPKGKLTRRYASYLNWPIATQDSAAKAVSVEGYVFETDKPKPPAPKSIFDLGEEGQKQFIRSLGGYETKSDELLNKIGKNITTGKPENNIVDFTKYEKRIVLSVLNLSPNPADRIAKLTVRMKHNNAAIRITSCDKIITRYETVDIGKVGLTNVTNLSLTGGLGTSGKVTTGSSTTTDPAKFEGTGTANSTGSEVIATNSLSGTVGNTRTFAEEVLLKQRYVALSASVTPTTVNLYEESVSGVELTGNLIADISFEFFSERVAKVAYGGDNLFKGNWAVSPDSITLSELYVYYPNVANDIELEYTYSFSLRHVDKGDVTISESDDVVTFLNGEVPVKTKIILLPKSQFLPKFWVISDGRNPLHIKGPITNAPGLMIFDSFDKAKAFLRWLKGGWPRNRTGVLASGSYTLSTTASGTAISENYVKTAQVTFMP